MFFFGGGACQFSCQIFWGPECSQIWEGGVEFLGLRSEFSRHPF